ncbi:MAG TPA: hypothetical protein VGR32_04705 [Brevundimonas sp.]|jgi:hypothetical protein|uniref:hypothetical protein n=1 Tax=Brevundimonas sp. TaxID=1871086 RepID=UPI002DF21F85|nr:hypothetical protein [Brevundimonas sp.]
MKRIACLALAVSLVAAPAWAQLATPPQPVAPAAPPTYVPDEAGTARYVADFTRLCLDTGGERAAVRAAAEEAGWTPGQGGPEVASAIDLAAFDSPDGYGGQLLTSASSPGDLEGGLIVRTCILQPYGGSAGPHDRLERAVAEVMGLPGQPTAQGPVWLVSGSRQAGFTDEKASFAAAGSPEAGFAIALERPLLMLTLVGDARSSGLALLRVSPE